MIRQKLPKHVHAYQDRHGKLRIYLRRPGSLRVALAGPLFSQNFWSAYHNALNGEQAPRPGVRATGVKPGTFDALIFDYYKSHYFTSLAPSTKSTYRNQLRDFQSKHGGKRVASIEARHLDVILGEIAERSTAQADKFRDRLKTLMKLAVKWNMRKDNPMQLVDRIKHVQKGYETWPEEDIALFRSYWPVGSRQRTAMEILLNTGLRRSDAVRLGRQHLKNGWFILRTQKSRGRVELNIPLYRDLVPHLESVPQHALTFVITEFGKSRSDKAFSNWIGEAAKAAGLPPHRSPHGLRKAACRRLAEAGCSAMQIMSITGHRNIQEVERYVREANQRTLALAARDNLEGVVNNKATKNG